MDAQVEEWHKLVQDRFTDATLNEKFVKDIGLTRQIALVNTIMAYGKEDETPYFNDLLQAL